MEGPAAARNEEPSDPNLTAITRADLPPASVDWLREVAAQVDPRLDRLNPTWREAPQADAARACAFGLLLGHLAKLHPHMRDDLARVAQAHPSYSTLEPGNRLETLRQIAGEPPRMAAWLGPLIDLDDPGRVRRLFD